MGKVKAMMMDMEEQFFDEALAAIQGCDHIEEFIAGCDKSKHLVSHMFSNDVEYVDYMSEMWSEYWSQI